MAILQSTSLSLTVPGDAKLLLPRCRIVVVLSGSALLLVLIGLMFWFQDVRYSLPTPRPTALREVARGQEVSLPSGLLASRADERPLLLHFFNPDCPCSRFNAEHVRTLRQRFGDRVRFVAVVQVAEGQRAAGQDHGLSTVSRLFGPDMEAVADEDGSIAAACGVYSTPQAAILSGGSGRTLLFRGNYNSARYCTDPRTEFVRQALQDFVDGQPIPAEARAAMVAYGCELPANVAAAQAPPAPAAKL